MNILKLCEMLENVEAKADLIKEEDKEPLNRLNRMLNGIDTMVLGQKEYDLVERVHKYINMPQATKLWPRTKSG